MHTLLLIIKWLMVGCTFAGMLWGYFVLFWDEEWEWTVGNLIGDFLKTCLAILVLTINPFRLGRSGRPMGPVGFFTGLAALLTGMYFAASYTLLNTPVPEMTLPM